MELPVALGVCVGAIAVVLFIYATLLKISTKLATSASLEWGAAIWTSVCILAANIVAGLLLAMLGIENGFVTGAVGFIVSALVINAMLDLSFGQSLIVAAILAALIMVLQFILAAIGVFAVATGSGAGT